MAIENELPLRCAQRAAVSRARIERDCTSSRAGACDEVQPAMGSSPSPSGSRTGGTGRRIKAAGIAAGQWHPSKRPGASIILKPCQKLSHDLERKMPCFKITMDLKSFRLRFRLDADQAGGRANYDPDGFAAPAGLVSESTGTLRWEDWCKGLCTAHISSPRTLQASFEILEATWNLSGFRKSSRLFTVAFQGSWSAGFSSWCATLTVQCRGCQMPRGRCLASTLILFSKHNIPLASMLCTTEIHQESHMIEQIEGGAEEEMYDDSSRTERCLGIGSARKGNAGLFCWTRFKVHCGQTRTRAQDRDWFGVSTWLTWARGRLWRVAPREATHDFMEQRRHGKRLSFLTLVPVSLWWLQPFDYFG
ncbi:hypothetical protein OIU85_016818 [Salix viminalis]|uniref:Uncharacterized protein n=1 Tax=Salix viminalis TaxID=40686 RepID=A0A9Q0V5Z1_SALVM|nr:hypothetical protein OIU85_016818 [Salix viminalis]